MVIDAEHVSSLIVRDGDILQVNFNRILQEVVISYHKLVPYFEKLSLI